MWKASPPLPPTRANHALFSSLSRFEVKASSAPSGLHRGWLDSSVGAVNRNASPFALPPTIGCSQISRCLRFSFSTMVITVKATMSPCGRISTSSTVTSL